MKAYKTDKEKLKNDALPIINRIDLIKAKKYLWVFLSLFITMDIYISYAVHKLLDSLIWSFQDIINISEICAEVRVKHKLFFCG